MGPYWRSAYSSNKGLCLDRNWRGTGAGDIAAQRGVVRHLRSKRNLVSELPQGNVRGGMHVPVSQAELAGQAGRVEAEAKAKSWAGWNVCGPEPRHAHNVRRVALIPNEAGACTARQSHARNQSRNLFLIYALNVNKSALGNPRQAVSRNKNIKIGTFLCHFLWSSLCLLSLDIVERRGTHVVARTSWHARLGRHVMFTKSSAYQKHNFYDPSRH